MNHDGCQINVVNISRHSICPHHILLIKTRFPTATVSMLLIMIVEKKMMTTCPQIRAHCHKIWSKKLDPNNPITAAVPHKKSRQNYCSDEENLTRSLLSRMCRGRICWWAGSCRWRCPPPPPPTPSPRPPAPPSRPPSTSGHLKQGSSQYTVSCGRHIFGLLQK